MMVGCGAGDGSTLDERGRSAEHPYAPGLATRLGASVFEATYEEIAFSFLEPYCVDCHSGGAPSTGLDLTFERAFDEMVGVSSLQQPGVLLVAAGDPDNSYLIIKLEGGSRMIGRRMPRGRPARPQGEIDIVRAWIEAGAEHD
ncbi:MAG: hypothetical protein ACFB9M_03650 [Myxococcota bacterium]